MAKKVDTAGMWSIKGNPITHDGVALYSGKAIDATGALGLDPDKLYPVYRPFDELARACESFNGKPLINDHEMIGTEEGLRHPDEKNIGGTIFNVRPSADMEGYIIADMTIFSQELQDAISDGKVELSLGYWCKYRPEVGTYNGVRYDFVQYDIEGNHIALVDRGRMGSGVRVFDNKEKTLVFDSMETPKMKKPTKVLDATELREQIAELLKDASDEALAKCKDILDPAKTEGDNDDPPKQDDPPPAKKEGEDDDPPKQDDPPAKKEGEDDDPPPAEKKDEPAKTGDAAPTMKQMLAEFSKREGIYKAVEPHVGSFDHAEMTAAEVAKYAAKKMGIATVDGAEVACVENYLKGLGAKKVETVSAAGDASEVEAGPSDALTKFLGE